MSTKAAEKIIEALTELVQGFAELQEQLENDFGTESEEDDTEDNDNEEASSELQDALVTEVRAAVESVIENEDCAPEDIASVISALTGALEEVAPEVFAEEEEADEGKESAEEEYEDEDDDEGDDDIDLDDDDYDYDEDEEEEDEDEDEKEEDEDDDD